MSFRFYWLLLLPLLSAVAASATHIVGGEVTYKCLGDSRYQIRLDIYQDCISGNPGVIAEDSPAYITIFTGSGAIYRIDTGLRRSLANLRVPPNFSNSCINNPPPTCLNRATFIKEYTLPPNSDGYYIVYQRCCRNSDIVNISRPSEVGATFYAYIPPAGVQPCNNSAVFKNYPPQIICINNPLLYDHGATDADGDSLSYEFCSALEGGSQGDSKPVPRSIHFTNINYIRGFSPQLPLNASPALQIDPKTGMITGTPIQTGRFVVTICCHEWRNHVLINTVTREFQFVVTNCSKAVVANIPQYSDEFNTYIVQCNGKTVSFVNQSVGANTSGGYPYHWDFGVPNINSDTSNSSNPNYTYPDTGVYTVKLVVNPGSTCSDSISRFVKVYPEFHADFESSGFPCPKSPVQFTDRSLSTYRPITFYSWSFGDGGTSSEMNPLHTYDTGGVYNVVLRAKNIKGCYDTVAKTYNVIRFKPFAGSDTIIVKGEYIYFNASGGDVYTWTPATYLNNPAIRNPVGYYPDTGHISYVVHIATETGCEGTDTINVWVVGQSAIFVPSAFSPNGDGLNDVLRPIGIGFRNINYFRVFNRWGQAVFYGTHFNEGWDGSNQGQPADIGTYYWELSVNDRFGKDMKLKGDATLIR